MNIYYKKHTVFCKYPFHQEVDYRYVEYSRSKKNFRKAIVFSHYTDEYKTEKERKQKLKQVLNVKKIELIKL
jgi:hypothetical protein